MLLKPAASTTPTPLSMAGSSSVAMSEIYGPVFELKQLSAKLPNLPVGLPNCKVELVLADTAGCRGVVCFLSHPHARSAAEPFVGKVDSSPKAMGSRELGRHVRRARSSSVLGSLRLLESLRKSCRGGDAWNSPVLHTRSTCWCKYNFAVARIVLSIRISR